MNPEALIIPLIIAGGAILIPVLWQEWSYRRDYRKWRRTCFPHRNKTLLDRLKQHKRGS